MFDSYGDGWNDNYYTLEHETGEQLGTGTLVSGSQGTAQICHDLVGMYGCYTMSVGGGSW